MVKNTNERTPVGLGVFILVFNRDFSKIMLLKRNAEKRKRWGADWGNIGGGIESREYSIDAGIREAKEEAGLELNKENIKLIEIKELPNFTQTHHGIHFAYATTLDESTPIRINEESDEYHWFEITNIPDSMLDSKEKIIKWAKEARPLFLK
jgi:8-oxo-dGTP pyrophosphatase MutT (NUDIX family)